MANDNFWTEYSESYDPVLLRLSFYNELLQKHISALQNCHVVLDNGAGTGNIALRLKGKKVFATDTSKDMARKIFEKINPEDEVYVSMQDSNKLRFEDNTFDGVTSMNVLYFKDIHPEEFIKEAYRVLRPKGIFALSSLKTNPSLDVLTQNAMIELKEAMTDPTFAQAVRIVAEANKRIFASGITNTYTHEEIADELLRAGFSKILRQEDAYCGLNFFVVAEK